MKNFVSRILAKDSLAEEADADSYAVTSRRAIQTFVRNPDNAFLVSFPRTGSHWLRMMMELYFERPSLTRIFYFPEKTNYLTLHTHDLDLDVSRRNVIYLYRDPVATVYSQIKYHGQPVHDPQKVAAWSELYGRHLAKWLHEENGTTTKTVIRYGELERDLPAEFGKVCRHFDAPLEVERLRAIADQVTRTHVKQKTTHDPKVVDTGPAYGGSREEFRDKHAHRVWAHVLDGRDFLKAWFESE